MNTHEYALFAEAQASLLSLVSRCLMRPDVALVEKVKAGDISSRITAMLSDAVDSDIQQVIDEIRAFEASCEGKTIEEIRLCLEVDYNRLFVGPQALLAPPYESYYASASASPGSGRLRTEAESAVVRAYAAQGYELPKSFSELPDHVAVELEFLALLSGREAVAWEQGAAVGGARLQSDQARFMQDHIGTWIEQFAERVERGAKTPFYPGITKVAAVFCS